MRRETGSPKILDSGNGLFQSSPELRVLALTKRHVASGNEIGVISARSCTRALKNMADWP